MLEQLFAKADIPNNKIILVHVRLSGIHRRTGKGYRELTDELLRCLLGCRPSMLLIPAFTIYSFMSSRIFHLTHARSEVGRFSEEIRRRNYPRTPDPLYSLLDILANLPATLDYHRTFGPASVFEYLRQQDAMVINLDMPGFWATPVHCVELDHMVPYRFEQVFDGMMQLGSEPWRNVSYHAYVRAVDRYGSGSYPPYNHDRRLAYLRRQGVVHEVTESCGNLAWAMLSDFCPAISAALAKDPYFLVDQKT